MHPVSTHLAAPAVALAHNPSARRASDACASVWASPFASRLASRPGRIEFVSYGLLVHLPLLSTSPRGDAVTFSYRPECACLERTHTSPTKRLHKRTSRHTPSAAACLARDVQPRRKLRHTECAYYFGCGYAALG